MLKRFIQTTLKPITRQPYAASITSLSGRSLFFRGLSTKASVPFGKSKIWLEMSEENKIASAISFSDPPCAEIAFYKGKGLEALGKDYYGEAITAYEEAARFDPSYQSIATQSIKNIYQKLNKNQNTIEVTENATMHLQQMKQNGIQTPPRVERQQEAKIEEQPNNPFKLVPGK